MIILLTMIAVGVLLGFTGAGGSGFVIAVLITFFDIPLHTALGTSMIAMIFTVISGAISHFKEGNVNFFIGVSLGVFASIGTFLGTFIARAIPAETLTFITAGLLFVSSFLIWLRTRLIHATKDSMSENTLEAATLEFPKTSSKETGQDQNKWKRKTVLDSSWSGGIIGLISGTCGLGSAPIIQVALLTIMKLDIIKVAGTTMFIIIPMAFFGGVGFYTAGFFSFPLLVNIVVGTVLGSYIGAKFTKKAPKRLLRFAMVYTPALSGVLMLLFSF